MGCTATLTHIPTIGCLSIQKSLRYQRYYVLKMTVNGVSMTHGLACWKIQGLCGNINPYSNYWPPFKAKMVATKLLLCPTYERQRSVNDLKPCILDNQGAELQH